MAVVVATNRDWRWPIYVAQRQTVRDWRSRPLQSPRFLPRPIIFLVLFASFLPSPIPPTLSHPPPPIHLSPFAAKSYLDVGRQLAQLSFACHSPHHPLFIIPDLTPLAPLDMEPDRQTMERIFAVLKHDWVYDFFFASQGDELDMLRHAATKGCVSTAEIDITTLGNGSDTESALHVGEHHRLLIMPSFTTGNITVGFAVNEKIASSSSVVSRDKYIGRIARDDENGTCLFIAEDFNEHITEVSYYTLFSPAHREHVFSLYKAKRFREVMKQLRKHYDPGELTKAVIYYYYSTEARPCPDCGAQTADTLANCTCKLNLRRKLHPQDDETEMKNVQKYIGGYCGVASVGFYNDGQNLYKANFASNSATRLTGDPEVQRRLAIWALCSAVKERSISPLAFTMGPGGLGGEKAVSVLDTFLLASIADSVLSEESSRKTAISIETEPTSIPLIEDGQAEQDLPTSGDEAVLAAGSLSDCSVFSPMVSKQKGLAQQSEDAKFVPMVADSPLLRPEKHLMSQPMPSSQMMPMAHVPQTLHMPILPQAPVVMPLSMVLSAPPEPVRERQAAQRYTSETRCDDGAAVSSGARSVSVDPSGSSALSGSSGSPSVGCGRSATSAERAQEPHSHESRQEPVLLAPAPGMQPIARYILPSQAVAAPPPPVSGGVSKLSGDDMDERRRKADQRKARNRESAQRSNHKRKVRIQALKDDIAEAVKREMYLRAREKMLREENRSLRLTASK